MLINQIKDDNIVLVTPSRPDPPVAFPLNETSIQVGWTVPLSDGHSPILSYQLRYRSTAGQWINETRTVSSERQLTIFQNLVPFTSYEFQACARNEIGTSPYSHSSIPVTTSEAGKTLHIIANSSVSISMYIN